MLRTIFSTVYSLSSELFFENYFSKASILLFKTASFLKVVRTQRVKLLGLAVLHSKAFLRLINNTINLLIFNRMCIPSVVLMALIRHDKN